MRTIIVMFFETLFVACLCAGAAEALSPGEPQDSAVRPSALLSHSDPQWEQISEHLPDPATSSPARLELQGDVLRARRFPEDALQFYNYALSRGGNPESLLKKIGVTELELHNNTLARLYFLKVIKMRSKDAEAWNNLGAVEFLTRRYPDAIHDYKRALKFARNDAVFHSNLGMAYFEIKDFDSARKEMTTAVKLDPNVFQRPGTTGLTAQLLSPNDQGRFCYEMARAYARMKNEDAMLQQLSRSSEYGFDVLSEMGQDQVMAKYRSDPRVQLLVRVARTMRAGRMPPATVAGTVAPLPPLAASPR